MFRETVQKILICKGEENDNMCLKTKKEKRMINYLLNSCLNMRQTFHLYYTKKNSIFWKVYRVYSNNQEFESIRLTETLSFFEDGKVCYFNCIRQLLTSVRIRILVIFIRVFRNINHLNFKSNTYIYFFLTNMLISIYM